MSPRRKPVVAGAIIIAAAGLAATGAAAARARRRGSAPSPHALDTPAHRGGSGTPLLLLHGIGVTWRTWKPVLSRLEAHHDVYAPTLLGHSGAAVLADGVAPSLQAMVDGVVEELDRLGLDKVHVAGNSMGGWIALELARRGRAASVVVFSPAGAWASRLRLASLVASMRLGFTLLGGQADRADKLVEKPWLRNILVAGQVVHRDRRDPADVAADIRAIKHSPVVLPLLKVLADDPMRPLPEPRCPVRIVWSRKDAVLPFRWFGEPMLKRVPSAELVWLEDAGHVPMSDDPGGVARLITEVTRSVDRLRNGSNNGSGTGVSASTEINTSTHLPRN